MERLLVNDMKRVAIRLLRTKIFWAGAAAFALLYAMFWQGRNETQPTGADVQSKKIPIYSVQSQEKVVALSFDAAWGNEDTDEILKILEKNDVKVTFFMTGGWVEKYPEDVKKIAEAGHTLANHSQNHKNMSQLSADECKQELMSVHNKVKELTGVEMELFRPPYGDYDDLVVDTAFQIGYYPIQWSVDSLDWKNYGVQNIVDTVLNHKALENGAIILMHNGAKYTAKALQAVIDGLKEKGYTFVTIDQLILRENYSIDHTGKQVPKK